MHPCLMPSPESLRVRETLEKERIDPNRTLRQERQDWVDYSATLPMAEGVFLEETRQSWVECLWVRPKTAKSGLILYAHGGGLVSGSPVTHRAFASYLAQATGRAVLLPNYRLLPENPIDAPLEDMIAVFEAILATSLPASSIALAGDSNGAALALSTAIALRDQGKPLPSCVISLSGAFDATLSGTSIKGKSDADPMLSDEVLYHWQRLFGGLVEPANPILSPLFANLHGLPPSLLFAGSDEVWLNDTTRMTDALHSVGNTVTQAIYPDMWHVWPMWPELPESQAVLAHINRFLDATLGS